MPSWPIFNQLNQVSMRAEERGEMPGCSRLCDLITASLLPHIEPKPSRLNKETEKDLLLSLSLVSREIQRWASEVNCQSEQDIVAKSCFGHYCCQHLDQSFKGDCDCLATIIVTMVSFLSLDSRFVQHLAGNILVSMSSFLTKCGSRWAEFIHLLWITLEAAISSICSSSSLSSTVESVVLIDESLMHRCPFTIDEGFGTEDRGFDFTRYIALLQSRAVNVNWLMVASLFRILRNIVKSLKQNNGDLEEVFMNLAVSSLIKMPWDLFSKIHASQSFISQMSSGRDELLDRRNGLNGIKDVLLGTVLQLFCSLVEQNDAEDVGGGPLGEVAVHSKFTNLMPWLLSCCFSKHLVHKDKCLSLYLRHKVLILMNRLSFHHQWQHAHPVLWLKLLRHYFEDLLYKSISETDAVFENCLEGSPFFDSINDGDTCTRHLQRQAIFLHFKCCFTLVRRKETGLGCACATEALSLTVGLQLCSENCCLMGLSELSEWLQRCGFLQKSMDCENYSESCSSFDLSFLQLYMEEDDMLFEMLLLLLDAPFFDLQIQSNANGRSLGEVERDVFYHISSIFNPIHLFHLFLLLLHYDHLVLIDYLISKDTGVHCVQYLLRCLRIICKSWFAFVEFSICGSETNQPCHKRRKISVDKDCNGKLAPLPSSSIVVEGQNMRRKKFGTKYKGIGLQSFANAKRCLLCLKRSVADLHQKSLFPYNPRPLLKSLIRFQELCKQ